MIKHIIQNLPTNTPEEKVAAIYALTLLGEDVDDGSTAQVEPTAPTASVDSGVANAPTVTPDTEKTITPSAGNADAGDVIREEQSPTIEQAPIQPRINEIDQLKAVVKTQQEEIEALQDEVQFLRGEGSEYDHEREATFHRFRNQITALRGEFNVVNNKYNDIHTAHQGALRRIKALEETITMLDIKIKEATSV